ncbi:hypothetical protein OAZ24_00140 [Synechococcus sp. AH-736-G21]|nr:hypothetical protein [Synechococcus sp. AH-736-G21]
MQPTILLMLVNAISEVLAGHADHAALAVLQVAVIDESHSFITSRDSMAVLMQEVGVWQLITTAS